MNQSLITPKRTAENETRSGKEGNLDIPEESPLSKLPNKSPQKSPQKRNNLKAINTTIQQLKIKMEAHEQDHKSSIQVILKQLFKLDDKVNIMKKKFNQIVGDNLYQITEKYFDDLVDKKVKKAVNKVVNSSNLKIFQNADSFESIKKSLLKSKSKLELDPNLVDSIQNNEKRVRRRRRAQRSPHIPITYGEISRNEKKIRNKSSRNPQAFRRVHNRDLELTQSQKVDILIDKVQEFQDLVVDIGEDYFGQLGEFSKDLSQRKMVKLGFEYLNLNP